jgi:hypothetical protein
MLEAPFGLGLGRRAGSHWVLFSELGARAGFGFYGRMYDRDAVETGGASGGAYVGQDTFALSLSVGLSLEE